MSSVDPLPRSADAVVVGGGIVGTASAFFLARAGLRPVIVERLPVLAGLATAQSMEAFRAQFAEPENVDMMLDSIGFYERFTDETGLPGFDIGIRQQGYLFLTTRDDGMPRYRERVASQRLLGLTDVELLTPDDIRRNFDFVTGPITAATFRQRDGWLSAHEAAQGFARASGAEIVLETEVTGITVTGGRVKSVSTTQGTISSPVVVIAAGPYAAAVAGLAGLQLPLANIRRHRLTLGGHALIPSWAPMTIDQDSGAHWRPESGGAALAWAQTHEQPGEPVDRVRPDPTFPWQVLEGVARLCEFWSEVAGSLKSGQVHLGAGQYTVTPDDKPIIGPQPEISGLFLNVGYGGHGVMAAPGGARRLADLIVGHLSDADNPFSFRRLARLRAQDSATRLV